MRLLADWAELLLPELDRFAQPSRPLARHDGIFNRPRHRRRPAGLDIFTRDLNHLWIHGDRHPLFHTEHHTPTEIVFPETTVESQDAHVARGM